MDFAHYQLGEMIHPNLVVKNSHSSFDILFSLSPPQMCTQPNWLCHQSITTKVNIKIFFPKTVIAPIICKNLCNSFEMWQFYWKHSNTTCHDKSFFLLLKFCTNVKFFQRKSLDLQKIKSHVVKFPYWFWFGNKILNA